MDGCLQRADAGKCGGLRAQQTWDWSNEMSSWFWGKKWSVKLLHLPTERGRSPIICHVKGVYISDSQRTKREPEHYVMHRPTSWQWGLGATTDKVEVMRSKEEGLRWARSLFHLLFLLLCPEARIAQELKMFQVLGVASGCQFCSMKQLRELPLSKVRNYLLREVVEKNHSHGEIWGQPHSLAFWFFSQLCLL